MRRSLELIYDGAAAVAAMCLVGVLVMVLVSIVSRQLGVHVPGSGEYAGYLMAGAGFLALAHTLKRGEHIRVTLLLQAVKGRLRMALELWALGVGTALAVAFAYYSVKLAWDSHAFNDVSTGNDATPLWIPQLAMAAGTVVLAIALIDELVLQLTGRRTPPQPPGTEPTRIE
jgi:TRAP-type C4-dicarboxylate transport system permease small subunit